MQFTRRNHKYITQVYISSYDLNLHKYVPCQPVALNQPESTMTALSLLPATLTLFLCYNVRAITLTKSFCQYFPAITFCYMLITYRSKNNLALAVVGVYLYSCIQQINERNNVMYIVNGLLRHSEIDNFNEGCDPQSSFSVFVDVQFKADTMQDLIDEICEFIGTDCYEIDPCGDEPDRIDWQLHEVEDRYTVPASDNDIALWKQGRKQVLLSDYTAKVERTGSVNIEDALK